MQRLTPTLLLDLADAGHGATPTERSVMLWAALEPDLTEEQRWAAPVGCVVQAMLDLRATMANNAEAIELVDRCPGCDEEVEFAVPVASLRLATPPRDNPSFDIELDGHPFSLRRLSAADLRAVERGEASTRAELVARCVTAGDTRTLDTAALDRIDAILAERDPQADINFAMTCQECEHGWQGTFDAGLVVWSELSAAARRLLFEVDALARAYHWSEPQILALSARRRRTYLEILEG